MIFLMMIIKNPFHVGWQLLCVWVDASRGSISQGGWNIICQGAGGGAGDDGDSGDGGAGGGYNQFTNWMKGFYLV